MSRSESFPVTGPVDLWVRAAAGTVEISTADTDTATVELTAVDGVPPAVEAVERSTVEASRGGGRITVEVPDKRIVIGRQPRVAIRISVPPGSRVRTKTASADVTCVGTYGEVTAHTASGEVRLGEVTGPVEVHSASGAIQVTSAAAVTVHTASGGIRIGRAAGDVGVHSASGDVAVGVAAASVEVRTASGDVTVDEASAGRISLSAASGDLRVGVRPGVTAKLDLVSHSGRVRSELPVDDDAPRDGAPLEIRARTTSGDLLVRSAGS